MTQNDFYGGFTSELVEPVKEEGLRNVIRHIHCCISEDKPIKGMYRDYLLDALDKIAKGSRPDTAFRWRWHEKNASNEAKLIDAMHEIYSRKTRGKILLVIQEVADELGFGFEKLKAEWYKNERAWEKGFDQYYEDSYPKT